MKDVPHGHARSVASSAEVAELGPCLGYAAQLGGDSLTEAFSRREFAAPWQGSRVVPEEEVGATLTRIFDTPRNEPAAAYVHVPYCQNHCVFCGFFQNVWRPEVSAVYVDDVVDEIARLSDRPLVASAPIESVYIGGGTPSALDSGDLVRLVESLRRFLPLAPDCEITLEGRAFGFGVSKAAAVFDAGVNRISIGVQSFDTKIRKSLGRKFGGEEVRAFLADLVALDRAAIVCDMIYGLPGQDEAVWRADIETAMELGLHGLSLYALNVWRGGPLFKAIENGKIPVAGTLPLQAKAYAAALEMLTARGWRHLTQAHFVNSPRERNRYNSMVKKGTPCLAFGAGAGGHAHGHRWRNAIDIPRRRALIAEGRFPVEGLAQLPPFHQARNAITAGLEDGEIDLAQVDAVAPGFLAGAAPLIENWVMAGLGELNACRFRTTPAGAFWMTTLNSGLNVVLNRMISTSPMPTGAHS